MSQQVTMQVGTLELRKTDEGWQYLSEGVGYEPDSWIDAASMWGPFGGSGLSKLLDELAAAKASKTDRETALEDVLEHIRGKSSCSDAWDLIDKVLP